MSNKVSTRVLQMSQQDRLFSTNYYCTSNIILSSTDWPVRMVLVERPFQNGRQCRSGHGSPNVNHANHFFTCAALFSSLVRESTQVPLCRLGDAGRRWDNRLRRDHVLKARFSFGSAMRYWHRRCSNGALLWLSVAAIRDQWDAASRPPGCSQAATCNCCIAHKWKHHGLSRPPDPCSSSILAWPDPPNSQLS